MEVKLFSVKSTSRKPGFDTLEAEVNAWLADHPDHVIEHTNVLSQPNFGWSHFAVAVFYTTK